MKTLHNQLLKNYLPPSPATYPRHPLPAQAHGEKGALPHALLPHAVMVALD
jgi:hypothetical protein